MFHIEVFGVKEAAVNMEQGAVKIVNQRSTLWAVREDIFRIIKATFSSQGRRYGGSWQQLTEGWLAQKEKMGWDPRTLYARHRLVDSWTRRGNRNMRSRVENDTIFLQSTLPYAGTHQFGYPDKNIPARPYIEFHARDRQRWAEMIGKSVIRAMNE